MNTQLSRLIGAGLFFLLIFVTGLWLSRTGRPYSAALFNIHKLIALAALAFLIVTYTQAHKGIPLTLPEWAAVILTAFFFVATMVTGGLQNLNQPLPAALLTMHRVLPFLTLFSTAACLYQAWIGRVAVR